MSSPRTCHKPVHTIEVQTQDTASGFRSTRSGKSPPQKSHTPKSLAWQYTSHYAYRNTKTIPSLIKKNDELVGRVLAVHFCMAVIKPVVLTVTSLNYSIRSNTPAPMISKAHAAPGDLVGLQNTVPKVLLSELCVC